jgi:hypothetical protein
MMKPETSMHDRPNKPQTLVTDHLLATGGWSRTGMRSPSSTRSGREIHGYGRDAACARHARREDLGADAIAVDTSCTHMYAPGVRRHIRGALNAGATKEEILAVLQAVLGIHSMALGVPISWTNLPQERPKRAKSN